MGFRVVPVLDLQGGSVVRAVAGARDRYRPLAPGDSRLVTSADPFEVVRAFRRLHPFRAIYLADLDAIRGHGAQIGLVRELEAAFPEVTFWLDAGIEDEAAFEELARVLHADLVVGSETLKRVEWLARRREEARLVLSLDHHGARRLGPEELFQHPELWPARVIVMTLAVVGTGGGPEEARIREIRARAGERAVFAAGGVRGIEDLERLRDLGCAGALVATCLHRGRLGSADLARLQG